MVRPEEAPGPPAPGAPRQRLLVLRHGSRPDIGADPLLDATGRAEAEQVAAFLAEQERRLPAGAPPITVIFSSPFRRALETAAPTAKALGLPVRVELGFALGLPVRVEFGFAELLAHGWLHASDPLPALRARRHQALPGHELLDQGHTSVVVPQYPDVWGVMQPGNRTQRRRALTRHRSAAEAALVAADGGSVLVVGHGSTHDFVADALCPNQHSWKHHTGHFCVPHGSITEIVEEDGRWRLQAFGHTDWTQVKWTKDAVAAADGQRQPAQSASDTGARAGTSGREQAVGARASQGRSDPEVELQPEGEDLPGQVRPTSAEPPAEVLSGAVRDRHRPELLEMLQACKDPSLLPAARGADGHSALHLLALAPPTGASLQACVWLLEARAELDGRNAMGETPLMLAVRVSADCADHPDGSKRRLRLVNELLRRRADAEAADPGSGETALMECADLGDAELCRLLLRAQADPLAKSHAGLTARAAAEQVGHSAVAELLLAAEAAVEAKPERAEGAAAAAAPRRRPAWTVPPPRAAHSARAVG